MPTCSGDGRLQGVPNPIPPIIHTLRPDLGNGRDDGDNERTPAESRLREMVLEEFEEAAHSVIASSVCPPERRERLQAAAGQASDLDTRQDSEEDLRV